MNRERANANVRRYRKKDPEKQARIRADYVKRNAHKIEARKLANMALRRGDIVKPSGCSRCGRVEGIEMHHEDYAKPLNVIWLCPPCHAKEG